MLKLSEVFVLSIRLKGENCNLHNNYFLMNFRELIIAQHLQGSSRVKTDYQPSPPDMEYSPNSGLTINNLFRWRFLKVYVSIHKAL